MSEAFMRRALDLARAQAGRTGVNPAVGCVLVKDGTIIGEGATADGGTPHGEEIALAAAGAAATGATVYVTLEPCAQRTAGGKSCSALLIEAGVAKVIVAIADPHPVGAGGDALLRNAGIAVETGVCAEEARAVNAAFFAQWKR